MLATATQVEKICRSRSLESLEFRTRLRMYPHDGLRQAFELFCVSSSRPENGARKCIIRDIYLLELRLFMSGDYPGVSTGLLLLYRSECSCSNRNM